MKYDRAAIMRESWRLRRKGMDASTALRWAWASAKRDARPPLPKIGERSGLPVVGIPASASA
ncbi:hypothetical protein Ms3S1_05100 [Methylosinus sp. 3S-1]|uniref:Uncharacterized protein n=1 Tax=Methylosinus trichosporium (strain ATCC 35070 / NCIMB 11131 / UNIQEM 75 / OB3b) TaxID=595536 RepID=A0A2D2CW16_METT3|nr:hypothetical protein CQW49_02575 [Methylosinus trichosporium OB3b]OBS54133.1 hypothetical protein A8B73_02570 [Methylosinus sp. 3S-1]